MKSEKKWRSFRPPFSASLKTVRWAPRQVGWCQHLLGQPAHLPSSPSNPVLSPHALCFASPNCSEKTPQVRLQMKPGSCTKNMTSVIAQELNWLAVKGRGCFWLPGSRQVCPFPPGKLAPYGKRNGSPASQEISGKTHWGGYKNAT